VSAFGYPTLRPNPILLRRTPGLAPGFLFLMQTQPLGFPSERWRLGFTEYATTRTGLGSGDLRHVMKRHAKGKQRDGDGRSD